MALEFITVESGPPPIYVYKDYETGDTKTSRRPLDLNGDEAGENSPPADGADQLEPGSVNSIGQNNINSTPNTDSSGRGATTSIFGLDPLAARAYEVKDGTPDKITGVNSVRSKSNAWSLLAYRNHAGGVTKNDPAYKSWNASTIHGDEDNILNPTAKRIVEYSQSKGGIGFIYSFRDFIQCEHYGQISNDYMITLRRFAFPVGDDLLNAKSYDENGVELDVSEPDLARAITWLSPALDNKLEDILSFGTGFGWDQIDSQVQTVTGASNDKKRGALGSFIDGSPITKAVEAGANGYTAAQSDFVNEKGNGYDPLSTTFPNHVYGPYNAIKSVLARNKEGLKFESNFALNFYYDLRGFDNTSPKVVFMDVLSNLLAITYNNAPFWGGATRYTGSGSTGKPFGDFNKLKNGDYAGYLSSMMTQMKSSLGAGFADIGKGVKGLMNGDINGLGDSKIMDNLIGGSLMKQLGSPSGGDIIQAFLTGDPTGQWHLTVGNPMNPMMVCGNLCLKDAKFEFEGPVGFEGFPSKLKMIVTLEPGRPRDKSEIESMFNAGRGRMYLQPEVEGKSLDDVVDVSQYGNKDRTRMTADRALRNSDFAAG